MKFYKKLEILKYKEFKLNKFSNNRRSYGNLYSDYNTFNNCKKENIRMNQLFNESSLYPFSPLINHSGYMTFRPNIQRNYSPYATKHSFYNKNNPLNQKFSSSINPLFIEKNLLTENSKVDTPNNNNHNELGNYMSYNNEDYPYNYSLTNRGNRFGDRFMNSKRDFFNNTDYGFYRPISKPRTKNKIKNKYFNQDENINTKISEYLNNCENNKKKLNLFDPSQSQKRRYKSNNNKINRSNYYILDQGKPIFTNDNDRSNIIKNKKIGEIENYFNKNNNNKNQNNFKLNKERLSFKNNNNINNKKINRNDIKYNNNKFNPNNNEDKNKNRIYNDSKDYFYTFNKENNNNINNNKAQSKKNSNASLNPSSLGFDHMRTFYTNKKKNSNNNVNIANSNINSASSRMMDTHYHFLNGLKMMSGEVNEYFYDFNSSKRGKNDDEKSVQSLQSLSDSKMMQLANHYICEEDDSVENYQMNNVVFNRKKHNNK